MKPNKGKAQVSHRPMTLMDLGQVMAIEKASFPTPWPVQAYRYEIHHKRGAICWVAEVPGEEGETIIAGTIVIWLVNANAHIATLSVHPRYRRQGIAQYLLMQGLLECQKQGIKSASLEVREGNKIAQNLYSKFGFSLTDVRIGYYADTHEDAFVMSLSQIDEEKLAGIGQIR